MIQAGQQFRVIRPNTDAIYLLGHTMNRILTIGKDCTSEQVEGWLRTKYVEPATIEVEAPAPVVKKGRKGAATR
jgi:hypothetical protein